MSSIYSLDSLKIVVTVRSAYITFEREKTTTQTIAHSECQRKSIMVTNLHLQIELNSVLCKTYI